VKGPHKGAIILEHEGGEFIGFVAKDPRSSFQRALDRLQRKPDPAPRRTLYRIFSKALPIDERGDVYASEWCADHDTFRDRCPHEPPSPTRVWARFGPRRNQTGLEAGAPGTRESKWHLLANDRQVQEPWLTACQLIVYGPIIEEYRSRALTPIGSPTCANCKRIAGIQERAIQGSTGTMG
jgi:hypothetical protein